MLAILLLPKSYFGLLNYNILSESMNYETWNNKNDRKENVENRKKKNICML